jgi:prepilin signal peptidase PulO-like enzyme (type II secretory pathway)
MLEHTIVRELISTIVAFILDIVIDRVIKDHRYNLISLFILIMGRYFAGSDFPAITDSSSALVVITVYKSILITIGCVETRDAYSFLAGMTVVAGFIVYYLDPKISLIKWLIRLVIIKQNSTLKKKKKDEVKSLEHIL